MCRWSGITRPGSGRLRVLVFDGPGRQFIPQDFIDLGGAVNVVKSYIERSDYS